MITEDELELIHWRAGRGCHFEGTFLPESLFAKQCLEEDVPRLIAEIRLLKRQMLENGAGEDRIYKTAQTLLDLYDQYGPNEFRERFGEMDNVLHVCRQIIVEGEGKLHPWPHQ